MTINKAYLVALRATVTLTSIPGMAPGLYDMFPDSFPGQLGILVRFLISWTSVDGNIDINP